MPLAEDTILAKRYRLDGVLASSDAGATYRAFDLSLKIPVIIQEKVFSTPEQLAELKQEAARLARLHHPALAGVINYFSFAGQHYLVMDFIEGQDLGAMLKKEQQPLDQREALNYIIQICQAVHYLHQQTPPVLHQNISPNHIRITSTGQPVLVHLGRTAQTISQGDPVQVGKGFVAPEQHRGGEITLATDIYALGATLYALLTGQTPPGDGKPAPPHQLNPSVNPQVSQAVMQALELAPADRPHSVAAWQKQLEALVESPPWSTTEEPPTRLAAPLSAKAGPAAAPPTAPALPEASGTAYWLVDATGLGYPIGTELFLIGRHPDADIVIEDPRVSRYQTQIRVDSGRCLLQDLDSANGTFINGHRLGPEWYPLNPGDLLTVGSARFHLTATRPVKLASPKPDQIAVLETGLPPAPAETDQLPSWPVKSSLGRGLRTIIWVGLLGFVIVAAFYFLADPARLPFLAVSSSGPEEMVSQAQTIEAGSDPLAAGTSVNIVESTRQAEQQATAVQAALDRAATATAQAEVAIITLVDGSTPASEDVARPGPTSTPTPPPSPTATPTIVPTRTPLRATPAATGPTPIPLEFTESINQIGLREVVDVDINPKNPAEVYAVVKRDGIYKSTNGGDGPWAKMKLDASGVVAFVIDPTNPARFYAPTWNAVLKSTDGGNTWDAKTSGLVSNRAVDVLAIDPRNPNTLYAGIGETLVVSNDGGETWSSAGYGVGLGLARLYAIVIDPFNSNTIYVSGLGASIYKSTDGGHNFLPMPYNTGQGAFSLAAHPTQKDVYLAGINSAEAAIIKTESGWEFDSVSDGLVYGGADSAYSALIYAPGNPNIVYAGSGYEDNRLAKGIFKSVDGGQNWASITSGLSINPDFGQPYYVKAMAVHPTNPDVVLAATGGGLYKSVDGGASWSLR